MRSVVSICLLSFLFGCSASKHSATRTAENLDGIWIPVTEELSGRQLPPQALRGQSLVIQDSLYTLTAESVDKGVLRFANGKMDIYGREGVNNGRHIPAIYKKEGDKLTICYNLKGSEYPEAFETKGKQMFFLTVFKKGTDADLNTAKPALERRAPMLQDR